MTDTMEPNHQQRATDAPLHGVPEVEQLLTEAIEMIEAARPMPLSTSLMINGEPLLELLHESIARLPEEIRAARWLLRERDEYLAGVRREGDEITAVARSHAERMVERTEVVRSAEQRARKIIADAEAEARTMRRQTEDFCDSRLATLEGILDRTRAVVATGRNRMQGTSVIDLTDDIVEEPEVDGVALFDQDLS